MSGEHELDVPFVSQHDVKVCQRTGILFVKQLVEALLVKLLR